MLSLRKPRKVFHVDAMLGGVHAVRGSLGTRNKEAAVRIRNLIEVALVEGPTSGRWSEVRGLLPVATYLRFAKFLGIRDRHVPTWSDLERSLRGHLEQRRTIGKLAESTIDRYEVTLREFEIFLAEKGVSLLPDITRSLVESFKTWRFDRIKLRKRASSGAGLVLDVAILHRAFAFGMDCEMIVRNPVRMEGRPGENPQRGAEPFTGDELSRLREHAREDMLTYLLLRWTAFRGSDAVSVSWKEVHLDQKEIERVTQKRKKKVVVPIQSELLFALEAEYASRKPQASDRVLLNPSTGKPLTRPRLYHRMLALGKRAGVMNAHPHRFRDTLAVDMLLRGGNPYDVAKILGDTIDTVERHYTPFVKELRDRVRVLLDNGSGLESSIPEADNSEETVTPLPQSTKPN
jgi:integrase/recombinase XerD